MGIEGRSPRGLIYAFLDPPPLAKVPVKSSVGIEGLQMPTFRECHRSKSAMSEGADVVQQPFLRRTNETLACFDDTPQT